VGGSGAESMQRRREAGCFPLYKTLLETQGAAICRPAWLLTSAAPIQPSPAGGGRNFKTPPASGGHSRKLPSASPTPSLARGLSFFAASRFRVRPKRRSSRRSPRPTRWFLTS